MFLNVMLKYSTASAPPVTPSWIVAQVAKPTKNLLLASWTDLTTPLKSVLGSTKSWCAGNLVGKVGMFVTLTIAPKTGSTKHLSPTRHTNLPVSTTTFLLSSFGKLPSLVVKLHGFVGDLWKHFRQIGIGLNLVVVFWCHNSGTRRFGRLRGCPFGAAACVQVCARLPMAICALLQHHLLVPVQHYQDNHHCVEPSYIVAQAWTLIKRFYGLLGPKLATPGSDKYPLPSQVYRWLGTKVDLIASPREIQVLPRESIPYVLSSARSFRPRNWAKVTLLRSVVNSVSLQDNCLVVSGACIWHLSTCVSTGEMVVPTSQLKSSVPLLFGCMFCLVALSGQFPRILAHRLSLR